MSFEMESKTRLNTLSADQQTLMIQDTLEVDIKTMVRLHGSSSSYQNNIRGIRSKRESNILFI